jgi:hypothetical protein
MPIICIGPVCIPISAVWPVLILLVKPIWNILESRWPWLGEIGAVKWIKSKFAKKPDLLVENNNNTSSTPETETELEKVDGIFYVKNVDQWQRLSRRSNLSRTPIIVDFSGL